MISINDISTKTKYTVKIIMSERGRMSAEIFSFKDPQPQLTIEKKGAYSSLLLAAKDAKAFPSQSGFYVRTGALTESGLIITGGNIEYALSDAFVHGETSVIAGTLAKKGKEDPIKAIGFYSPDAAENPPSPCGNCRDVIHEHCDPDLVLLTGSEKRMSLTPFKEYLFDSFAEVDPNSLEAVGHSDAALALNQALSTYLPDSMKSKLYGAALVTEGGNTYRGSFYSNAAYDSSPPLFNAIQTWRNTDSDLSLSKVVIASSKDIADPSYRDRQALLEFDEAIMLATGRKKSLPIELVTFDPNNKQVINAAMTDSREWIPHPFSPKDFGMDQALEDQISALHNFQ
jgi:cytidine deaminase